MQVSRTGKKFRVLVLEGSLNASLVIVRSLGRLGADVTVADHRRVNPARLSRYAAHTVRYPNPEEDKDAFIDFLAQHVRRNRYDIIFPVSDFTVIPIALHRGAFDGRTRVAIAPTEQVMRVQDKAESIEIVRRCGVGCPKTHLVQTVQEIHGLAKKIRYPVIVKPRSKISWVKQKPFVHKVTGKNYVSSADQLVGLYTEIHQTSPLPMVQEIIPGEAYGFFALAENGNPRAVFGHKRIREYPLSGGMSTCRESYMDPELMDAGCRILKELGWTGVAMVEFKRDARDGRYKFMEVNGRWWGSLALAVAAGVDFPGLYAEYLLTGALPKEQVSFKKGVQCRALIPWDMLWLAARMGRSGRLEALREFFFGKSACFDIFSWSDPLPALGTSALLMSYAHELFTGRLTLTGERQ